MSIVIAVDFDGTIVDHQYPRIGPEVPGAIEWLRRFQEAGARLVLWTMRSEREDGDDPLDEAVRWCSERGIEFWGVNSNPDQHAWTKSPKQYAHVYVDDAAFGVPLLDEPGPSGRPMVDWSVVGPRLFARILSAGGG